MRQLLLVAALALGTVALKAVGPLVAGGRRPPRAVLRVVAMLTPALIGALVLVDTVTEGGSIVLDARIAGVAVGAVALLLRAPTALALVLAAAATALLRALG